MNFLPVSKQMELIRRGVEEILPEDELEKKLKNETVDVSLPHNESLNGKIHPISQTIFNIIEIFGSLNYSVEAGPDIENDFNNFSAFDIAIFL